jgi:hypothetical protein
MALPLATDYSTPGANRAYVRADIRGTGTLF